MKNSKKMFWGILFLLGAVAAIVGAMGFLEGVNFWSILFTIALIGILLDGIVRKSWGQILFPMAFIAILNSKLLGIENLTPWPVLGAAILGTIGLHILFPRKWHWGMHHWYGRDWRSHDYKEVKGENGEENVRCETSFGSAIKYISCKQLSAASLESSFGTLEVYFNEAYLKDHNARVNMEVSFGHMSLYVPADWKVILQVQSSFGHVNENGVCNEAGENVLFITGDVSFGGAEINYI